MNECMKNEYGDRQLRFYGINEGFSYSSKQKDKKSKEKYIICTLEMLNWVFLQGKELKSLTALFWATFY